MKNQKLFIALLIALLLRHIVPYVDIFIVFLVIQLLTHPDNLQLISLFAVLAAFVSSLVYDSPLGLFPLVLAICLLVFGIVYTKYVSKDRSNLLLWLGFSAACILIESSLRATLTVGSFMVLQAAYFTIAGTIVTILLITFALSFRRKI
ncbi:hypothetical protein CO112_01450 [Candidatus Dojkabacteria bacterium CG_4_9_14_3_um_filter_150_Dojkabacteria_WS6_41_13]|uniref:Uncharacterized protein n=1 Tax=Candidatus Dojkabacteria bacterium CG_4_10_14_0_2_um_filter_Dojkabacteria_WS6_41_15 TaxID=2014249 RepID=A0A2M7W1Q3_9BACT|nr:MAG: hypothetical protein COZ14_01480 [Candidatus Dojkabacteria bacterium CG_4_10_14_3_um_filter_Dojkabacteria_WS6_41_9]PJA13662.1 MAG: hypothetical protein COX64_03070 [Candidatus Dojkabacteria bacterium CG_4_10_14_0_2_um_filter_Dojkabacteria_WS6_41_15]PJB23116.1 MAG: hypothetical protein CO112_01450 [Candidatus Dojkabacteria bacterium CG_4_9_14_3_um_filter_150_Dojkabacteria_WS6_41_13]